MHGKDYHHLIMYTELESVKQICAPLKILDIDEFSYVRSYPDGGFVTLTTYIEWADFFLKKFMMGGYSHCNITEHLYIAEGVSLWHLNPYSDIIQEGKAYFNCGEGITICTQEDGYAETTCYMSYPKEKNMNAFFINNIDILKQFKNYFREKAEHLIHKEGENKLMTPDCYLDACTRILKKRLRERSLIEAFRDKLDLENKANAGSHKHLTDRELRCICLAATGLSSKQIADRLFISTRTVEKHFTNAREKLQCTNICELISRSAKHYPFEVLESLFQEIT